MYVATIYNTAITDYPNLNDIGHNTTGGIYIWNYNDLMISQVIGETSINTTTSVSYGQFQVYPFTAVFEQGELPQTSTSSNTGGGITHPPTNIPSSDQPPSSGLPKRAAAALGIGTGVGMLLLSDFGFFLYNRRQGVKSVNNRTR
jgi:hypothetical protein